jgi:hypothetical protein
MKFNKQEIQIDRRAIDPVLAMARADGAVTPCFLFLAHAI